MVCPIEGCGKKYNDGRAMRFHIMKAHEKTSEETKQLMDSENLEYYKQSSPTLVKEGKSSNVTMVTQKPEIEKNTDEKPDVTIVTSKEENEEIKLEEPPDTFTGLEEKFDEVKGEILKKEEPQKQKDNVMDMLIENIIREEENATRLENQLCEDFNPETITDPNMLRLFLATMDRLITHGRHHRHFTKQLIERVR